jgi:DNA-binding XRE family transcriptional regulator
MNIAVFTEKSLFSPRLLAEELLTTQDEIARTAGLGRDAIARKERLASAKTQTRLREMVEVVNRLTPRFGSSLVAYAWYRSEPLPGFGGLTSARLVQDGMAGAVMEYLDEVDAGGFA